MGDTKPLSSQPAGMQLTHTKRSARIGLHPNTSVSAWQTFKPCFPFHLHKTFLCLDLRHMCVCLYFLQQSSDSTPFCSHLLVGRNSEECVGLQAQNWRQLWASNLQWSLYWGCYWPNHILEIIRDMLTRYAAQFACKHIPWWLWKITSNQISSVWVARQIFH